MLQKLPAIVPGRLALSTVCFLILVPATAVAVEAPPGSISPAPDIDVRGRVTGVSAPSVVRQLRAAAPAAQVGALAEIELAVPDLRVRWSTLTGSPSRIHSTRGALTGPSRQDPETRALGFINEQRALFNLGPDDVDSLRAARSLRSSASGASYVTLQQQVRGYDVLGGRIKLTINAEGMIRGVSGEPIPDAARYANSPTPVLSVEEAIQLAAEAAGVDRIESGQDKGLYWFPLTATELRLVWNVTVADADSPNAYRTLVDAADGRILWRQNLTDYAHQTAKGRVYTSDSPDPGSPSGTASGETPGDNSDPEGPRPREVVPFNGEQFFPHDDDHADWWNGSGEPDYSRTFSNNVIAQDDRAGGSPVLVTTDPTGDFTVSPDFDIDVNMPPDTYINSSVVNLFYWYNRLHDFWYRFGFDEASGNAQVDNFGLPGMQGDPIFVDAQDTSQPADPDDATFCNAFMRANDDGTSPQSRFLICDRGGPVFVDAGLDNTVVAHEFGHLVVRRLLEGQIDFSQGVGMNEGFSDLFGLTIFSESDDDVDASYGIGGWYGGNPDGTIRRQFYSTDPTVFKRRYADIVDGAFCAFKVCSNDDTQTCSDDSDCGMGNTCDTTSCSFQFQCEPPNTTISQGPCRAEEHRTGEIWANTLWIAYANLVKKFDYNATRTMFHQLVVDGLKGAPDFPDFLDMRDAILTADLDFQGGAGQCLLWDAFARMGVGVSALSGGSEDINVVQAFDTPPQCTPNIDVNVTGHVGLVCLEDDTIIPMQIFNNGTGDLIVNSITFQGPDAGEFSVDPFPQLPVVIPEGAHVDFTIHHSAASDTGVKSAEIVIASSDPDEPELTIPITAEVGTPDINVAIANSGNFGGVCEGGHADLSLTLFNQGTCNLTISDVEIIGDDMGVFELPQDLSLPLVLSPDADFSLPVRFAPDSCFDVATNAQVKITSDDPDETMVNVGISGSSPCPDLTIDPADLTGLFAFPATVVDTTGSLGCYSERNVVLRNTGVCPLTIGAISAAGADFAVTAPTQFPILLPAGEETLNVTVRFIPQSDADPLAPSEVTGQLTIVSDDPDGAAMADLCGESAAQSGVRILVTDFTSGTPVPVDSVDRINIRSKGLNQPGPINLTFTDVEVSSAQVCGNTIDYHVDRETLPATETTGGGGGQSSYQAKAKEGNLQAAHSFTLGRCELKEFQLQLQSSGPGGPGN